MSGLRELAPEILREYDIRGIFQKNLSQDVARMVGRAFAAIVADRVAPGGTICVGRDGRLSSPVLEAAIVEGLRQGGAQVVRVGIGPTPMLYYACHTQDAAAGVMVTGSHNPPDHNGFKMMVAGKPFFGDDIQEIGRRIAGGLATVPQGAAPRDLDLREDYTRRLAEEYRGDRALRVAWDAGNGAAGEIMDWLTKRLPGTHFLLNEVIDGTFPAHHPDPTVPENLVQLIDTVKAEDCDLGLAFDGDGDRLGVVDGQGRILWGDQVLCLLAEDVLRERPGETIIADVKASQVLFDHIARCGGNPIMWKTGHSPIKNKMRETGAPLAGEMSGHIFFADRYYGFDDGLYAAVRLLDIVARSDRSLAEMRDELPEMVNTPEIRMPCDDTRKFDVVREVADRLASEGAEVNDVDGVRVNTTDGWWLLRASNTQPVLVARCESGDEAGLERLKTAVRGQLAQSGVEASAL